MGCLSSSRVASHGAHTIYLACAADMDYKSFLTDMLTEISSDRMIYVAKIYDTLCEVDPRGIIFLACACMSLCWTWAPLGVTWCVLAPGNLCSVLRPCMSRSRVRINQALLMRVHDATTCTNAQNVEGYIGPVVRLSTIKERYNTDTKVGATSRT